jgi:hypothetical protein
MYPTLLSHFTNMLFSIGNNKKRSVSVSLCFKSNRDQLNVSLITITFTGIMSFILVGSISKIDLEHQLFNSHNWLPFNLIQLKKGGQNLLAVVFDKVTFISYSPFMSPWIYIRFLCDNYFEWRQWHLNARCIHNHLNLLSGSFVSTEDQIER